jgi:hypothetical protein
MPEHLRAFIVIIFLAFISFFSAKKIIGNNFNSTQFKNYRNGWIIINCLGFLTLNYWVFTASTLFYLIFKKLDNVNPSVFYAFILFAMAPIPNTIPGFGLINYFININYYLILSLGILLPAYLKLITNNNQLRFGRFKTDVFFVLYLLLKILLTFYYTTFTDGLRTCFLLFLENVLPYYVISRSIKDTSEIKLVLTALIIACIPAAFLGVFENVRHWLLYTALQNALGIDWGFGHYLGRGTSLRALVTFGQPIIFGYAMMVGLGAYLYLNNFIQKKSYRIFGFIILLLGLIAPLSRGPWVGAFAMVCTYLLLSSNGIKKLFKFLFLTLATMSIAAMLPGGQKIINLIPFLGKTDHGNIEYRQILFDVSVKVFQKNPLLGRPDFDKDPEMIANLLQGEGIVDVVNSYIAVALGTGIVGLILFTGFLFSSMLALFNAMKKIKRIDSNLYTLGQTLLSIMVGIVITIATVSEGGIITTLYLVIVGLSVAYCNQVYLIQNK